MSRLSITDIYTEHGANKMVNSSSKTYNICAESTAILNGVDENVICIIHREHDPHNPIIYRAKTIEEINPSGDVNLILCPKDPVDIFRLKLSGKDIRKHRDACKYDDRVELNKFEKKMIYGVKCKKIVKVSKTLTNISIINDMDYDNNSYLLMLNILKKKQLMNMILRIDPNNNIPSLYSV
eukprot:290288_1